MIKVGLVGEDPNDTSSIKNLLDKRYKNKVQFIPLVSGIKGHHLDNPKIKNSLPIEFNDRKCNLVIFIRDLDALESNKAKLKSKKEWFNELDKLVNNKGVLLLNIWELEALILGDIDTFNKLYSVKYNHKGDPMFQNKPKEFLKQITFKSNKKFHENDCPKVFEKLDINKVLETCSCLKNFIVDFDKRLAE